MSVKPCNIRIPSGLSDAQVAADAACAAKRYAYSAEQVESRLNSYVDDLTGLDLERIAANTAAAAEVVERTEAAAATAQYSAEIVERLAPEVKDMLDTIVEQDLEQLRQDIEVATNLIATVDGKVSDAQQAATDARGSALQADQSETAAEAALAETWIAYSAVLDEKDSAAAHFAEEAVEKVAEAVTAQLNPGGDFYAALNTAVTDTIPNTVKENADEYVTELTTEGGSLYNYVEASKAEISSLQGGAVSTIITHREAALTAITTAKDEAIESIGNKVDADIAAKINPEYISEKVNAVLPGLIDAELTDENGAWNTAKNEAIADATDQAELARQWATSDTHVAGTSYSGAYGYMLITERLAGQAQDDAASAAESASASSSSADAALASQDAAEISAGSADESQTLAKKYQLAAQAFAVDDHEDGFEIIDDGSGPEIQYSSGSEGTYKSAKIFAYSAKKAAESAETDADTARQFAISEVDFRYIPDGESYSIQAVSARTWAASENVFYYSYKIDAGTGYNTAAAASARMWAEAEDPFQLGGEEHKSAKAYADLAKTSETNAANSASAAKTSEDNAERYSIQASNHANTASIKASDASSEATRAASARDLAEQYSADAKSYADSASDSASAAKSSETNAASSENLAERYMEVAEAFAISNYEGGFGIIDNGNGPEVVPNYSSQSYSSAKTYADRAYSYANTAYSWAEGDSNRSARHYANTAYNYANTAYNWAARDTVFEYSIDGYSQPRQVASARMWAEAEESFSLNDEVHKSAKAWAKLAETDEAEALLHAQQANAAAADAAIAYEGTLNAYSSTLDAYRATKAAVSDAETYLTEVNAVKSAIDQTLYSSNWTANNITVDDSGAFTVTPGLVYAVWSKEVCEIYKDAALEDKLCTIWAEEQRCILATQATYYVSPVEQAASVIITSVQYTQPSA